MGWTRPVPLLLVASTLAACKASPEAPTELDDLSRYLFREWDADDPAVMEDGLVNLLTFLESVDLEADAVERSWLLEPLAPEDVASIERPDRDLTACTSVSLAGRSPWPVNDHARVQTEADQTPFEPTAKDHYDRRFLEPDDPSCFVDVGCPRLLTLNEATRANLLMKVTFELHKSFRWFALPPGDDGEERWAIAARSWFSEPFFGEGGKNTLWQSYSIDVWLGVGDDETWRLQTLWSESELGVDATETQVTAVVRGATDQVFRTADEQIGALYYGE